MKKLIKNLFRYTGISLGLFIMLLAGCALFYAVMLLVSGIIHFVLFSLVKAFFILVISLIGISIGFHVFEYFGERF